LERTEEIDRIKKEGLNTILKERKMEVIDTLATYGKDAVNPIMDIVNATIYDDVKSHAFQTIQKINEKFKA
jgi:hypothetical protein